MNTAPAMRRSQCAGTTRVTADPASTAIAEVAISASAEPANTAHLARAPAAIDSVASCVLSPSSATKIAPKVEARVFQSMPGIIDSAAGAGAPGGYGKPGNAFTYLIFRSGNAVTIWIFTSGNASTIFHLPHLSGKASTTCTFRSGNASTTCTFRSGNESTFLNLPNSRLPFTVQSGPTLPPEPTADGIVPDGFEEKNGTNASRTIKRLSMGTTITPSLPTAKCSRCYACRLFAREA